MNLMLLIEFTTIIEKNGRTLSVNIKKVFPELRNSFFLQEYLKQATSMYVSLSIAGSDDVSQYF